MTPALRWAAMRAILMFHNCEGQSHKTVSTDHNFWRERRAGADSNRGPSAYQPNALALGQTGLLCWALPITDLHTQVLAATRPTPSACADVQVVTKAGARYPVHVNRPVQSRLSTTAGVRFEAQTNSSNKAVKICTDLLTYLHFA